MGTKVTSSSGPVLKEPEIQKLQMQAKIFKENSLNKLNALKSTTQLLERQSILYQQAFAQLFGDSVRTFKFQLSQHMNNLETLLNAETLHEMDSKSALSVIKVQFERFINSDLLKPLDIYSRSFSSDREVRENFRDYTKMTAQTFKETIIQNMNSIEQCIIERASHEQELKMTLKKLSERQLQIQQCKVQEVQSSVTSSGDETSSGIVSDEEIDKQELEAHYSYMAKIQEVSPEESSSTSQPLEQVQNHDENDVFANVRRHSEQPESINDTYVLEKDDSNVIPDSSNICTNDNQVDQNAAECVDERAALANLIANLTLDTEENKTVLKQLKKANASLTQELKECKTNLDESSRALGEATSSRDSSLIALQTKQTELEKYTALNDLTSDYKILQTKLNETLGLLALKDIDIKEGLKTKTYEISVVNQKHDELVKKSLLTRSQFEGQLKEKTKVISDLKVKEGKDIDTMIEMDKQIKFLNEILYKRNQSIQTIHMLAPKCATYHGRSTFANPKYLKKAQSDKPRLYEIPYDTSDPANRFCPDGEETVTLEKESRSKLDKDTVKPYNYTYQNSLYETFKPPSKAYLDQLERAKEVRKTMWRKTFVRTKPNIAKNVGFLPMSKSISKSRLLYNEMTNNFNHFRTICQQTWSNHTSSAFPNPTAKSMEVLIKILLMPLSDKTILDSHCFIHELKREMNDDLEYVNSLEKELDELESEKADFSNIYDLLLEECVSKDVTCSYLHSLSDLNANTELQCLYLHKVKECECLAQKLSKQTESVNKEVHNNLLKSFSKLEKHSISLELSLQHCKEQMKNNPVCKENASNVFRKEREQYHEIQDLKAQMQDKNMVINELKKLILVTKGKSVETQFDKPSVVRQPNAQRIPKPSVLGKPTPFSNSPEMRSFQTKQSVNKTNVSDNLIKQVTQQNLPQNRKQAEIHSNVLKPGMYRIATTTTQNREPQLPHASRNTNPHVSKSSGVNHTTSVSRPQLKCYQVKDKVVPITISQASDSKESHDKLVFYVDGLNHNLFSVGQFGDAIWWLLSDFHSSKTPELETDVCERRNPHLVVACSTMLSASKLPLSFWAEAVATRMLLRTYSIIMIDSWKDGVSKSLLTVHGLVPSSMTSDHTVKNSDSRPQARTASSKLVPTVVPLATRQHTISTSRWNYYSPSHINVRQQVVRLGINPMIQPESEDLPKDNPKLEIAVLRYSNPMIQPKPEGSTQGYPLVSVEVLRYDTKGEKVRIGNDAD
ncbi:hypothetical protein Tco_0521805 [Tanacetum coccineum]